MHYYGWTGPLLEDLVEDRIKELCREVKQAQVSITKEELTMMKKRSSSAPLHERAMNGRGNRFVACEVNFADELIITELLLAVP